MTTTTNKKKEQIKKKVKIVREVHQIDASNKAFGRLSSEIAILLMGKNKASYQRHIDMGDSVVVKNIKKVKITGQKLEQKIYYRHSTYPGGLKKTKMKDIFEKDPEKLFKMCVIKMLPKNKLRNDRIKRLQVS